MQTLHEARFGNIQGRPGLQIIFKAKDTQRRCFKHFPILLSQAWLPVRTVATPRTPTYKLKCEITDGFHAAAS